MEPLTFEPIIVPKPWGGRRLERFGKELAPDGLFGESWEVADLPTDAVTSSEQTRSRVSGGADDGATLSDLISLHGSDLLGSARATERGDFPLLVKFLDAREHLSVQVHPTGDYVARHPGTWLKTESWCVVDADPGAVLYKGFRPGVTMEQVAQAAGTRDFVELLQAVDAVAGDFHHLPAGIVHALGAGVLVAEIQTPSDTTFRLYDWTDEYGRAPRPLHIGEGLDTVALDPDGAVTIAPLRGQGS
ncbi:MAG: class I mannose-6-phosphate isomerase, partial [Acidimicrobiia bacterium]|nr:class I mannose-6-phosphate isomerase [Acidimicrobiia bacterium]